MTTVPEPKMVKYVDDECYGLSFDQLDRCPSCWLRGSCETTHKSRLKKEMMAKSKVKKPKPEKKYKKTDKHRDW